MGGRPEICRAREGTRAFRQMVALGLTILITMTSKATMCTQGVIRVAGRAQLKAARQVERMDTPASGSAYLAHADSIERLVAEVQLGVQALKERKGGR